MNNKTLDLGLKAVGVIVLLVALLFLLTWSGIIKCGSIPYWCDIYESVMGGPRVLIVHGDDGLGDPDALKLMLLDPQGVAAKAVDEASIDRVSLGNLKGYKLVIVDHCKKISIDQLEMFMSYVNTGGGRLVWVGDAGTVAGDDEKTDFSDTNGLAQIVDNPWVRVSKNADYYINFDEFLGLRYVDNFCNLTNCSDNLQTVGLLKTELTGNHPLIFGLSPALSLKIKKGRDFGVVRQFANSSNSNIVLSLEFGSVINVKGQQLPKSIPIIATSGMGERVAYYAYPPEFTVQDNNYMTIIKNMYYGMLGK